MPFFRRCLYSCAAVLLLQGAAAQAATVVTPASLRLALEDLIAAFGAAYPEGEAFLRELDNLDTGQAPSSERLIHLAQRALLANPLLDFEGVLLVRRSERQLGLPQNWESNSSIPRSGIVNSLVRLDWRSGAYERIYRPKGGRFVGDIDLHFSGDRLLFSMPDEERRWGVFELTLADGSLRQLPLIPDADVDNYDACYLPNGDILFCSTAPFVGVPCVKGSSHVCHLYRYTPANGQIRRLTFEQDHDWCPTLLENGRVLYLRWEYSDIPHFASRILFHMNPDGTGQMEYYGSNSYWPNALFYARPIPGHPGQFAAIVGGHHDVPRMGELTLFDTAKGRFENQGVLQRIPGYGQPVEAKLLDGLVKESWPKCLHPWPLSDHYFLVSMKPSPEEAWGLYLVDIFDNRVLLKEEKGWAFLEPIPLKAQPTPPSIPDKVDPEEKEALVYLTDVYAGPGLQGVPRGSVKQLRLFTYHFAYHGVGGQQNRVGLDGPWDIKRVLGVVPVEADGSALFRVPANTPIAVQPLDADGAALQLMRSWFTAMPGETLSCAGCHEAQNSTPALTDTLAAKRAPQPIAPWYGPTRGFSFQREVQPVLDAHCVGCHNGASDKPDFRDLPPIHPPAPNAGYKDECNFSPSYLALRAWLRTPSIESDLHLLPPAEFHANTTPLIRHLRRGHQQVKLSPEDWDRLLTWIDLSAPMHGTWHEIVGPGKVEGQRERRRDLLRRYAGIDEDPEAAYPVSYKQGAAETSTAGPLPAVPLSGNTIESVEALTGATRQLDLGAGVALTLRQLPGGVLKDQSGQRHRIGAFWMAETEITNAQFAAFDPQHDSRLEHGDFLQFSIAERGYPLNAPDQPVVRVSWEQAQAFCQWLSKKTGSPVALPSAVQWAWAAQAATGSLWCYGGVDADFAAHANLADQAYHRIDTFPPWSLPSGAIHPWRLAVTTVDDGHKVAAPVKSYGENPWGLYDLLGNAAEWVGDSAASGLRLAVGGSWAERPKALSHPCAYPPWQRVYNVGFRVVLRPQSAE